MEPVTILGLIAGTLTTISFLPQVIKTIKTKHVKDLSLGMYLLIFLGIFLWAVYGIFRKDLPVILANGTAFILTGIILVHIIKYKE
jgi:MtN3 and saliva related transmembrane protein